MERLPEECLSRVLSLTSTRDVCRSSAVSKALLSAAESDLVWDRFLPPDYEQILHRSSPPVAFASKRDLYFRLCDPILVDGGSKILWLEKASGKKCYMLSARALGIIWGNDNRYWRWISPPDARFPEVAELRDVCWFEIRASISCRELSPGTRYGAYLLMRYSERTHGLEHPLQEPVVSVGGFHASTRKVLLRERGAEDDYRRGAQFGESWWLRDDGSDVEEDEEVAPPPPPDGAPAIETGFSDQPVASGGQPSNGGREGVCVRRGRGDGWMELEMGGFFIKAGGEELGEVRLMGWQRLHWNWKSGLIVHGVEIRPMPRNIPHPHPNTKRLFSGT